MIVPKNASNKMLFQKCDKEKMVKNQKISAAPIGTGECRGGWRVWPSHIKINSNQGRADFFLQGFSKI